jgi:hemerythrin-like domain-containing protein
VDVLTILRREHAQVKSLFREFEGLPPESKTSRERVSMKITDELVAHDNAEEHTLYDVLRRRARNSEERLKILEAFAEHEVAADQIAKLRGMDVTDDEFTARFKVLMESVEHHVKDEEENLHEIARELLDEKELDDLGRRFEDAKKRAMVEV